MSWTIGNRYLTQSEMEGNAQEVYSFFAGRGWTRNAIAGILGNMQTESNINPGLWQSLKEHNYSGGFGLVQWTPATKYTGWATANGYSVTNPAGQLKWIDELSETKGQWIKTSAYNMSWSGFKKSTETAEYLASAFLKNFERAGVEKESERRSQAASWYTFLEKYDVNTRAIEAAVKWAVAIANDDSHGYDQGNRWGPDYDCSSLLITAWQQAGVKVKDAGAWNTNSMYNAFLKSGFHDITSQVNLTSGAGLKRGDVLLKPGSHTAMSIGNGQVVQASHNENGGIIGGQTGDQIGKEIWCTNYYNFPWSYVLRLPGSSGSEIITSSVRIVRWIPA